jgi:hypothetical protein
MLIGDRLVTGQKFRQVGVDELEHDQQGIEGRGDGRQQQTTVADHVVMTQHAKDLDLAQKALRVRQVVEA